MKCILGVGAGVELAANFPRDVGPNMQQSTYLKLVLENAEELTERLALAKKQFARQNIWIKAEHSRELEQLHSRCTEFKRRVEDLEEAEEQQREYDYAATEMAWNQSMDAVDVLLRALS